MSWKPMPSPDAAQLVEDTGRYMTALLREAGLTQAATAKRLGMSARGLRVYLNGQRSTASLLYQLQYAIESLVGSTITRRIRKKFGLSLPRV